MSNQQPLEALIDHEVAAMKRRMLYLQSTGASDCGLTPWSVLRLITTIETARSRSLSAAPADEDRELAERLRMLLSSAFIIGHSHGPSKDYQVQLKFPTLDASQRCHTIIEALAHPECRASFVRQGVLEPLAATTSSPAAQPEIERFTLKYTECDDDSNYLVDAVLEPAADGDYVRYLDHERIVKSLEAHVAERDALLSPAPAAASEGEQE